MNLQEYNRLTNRQKVEYFAGLGDSQRQHKKLIAGVGVYDRSKPSKVNFTVAGRVYHRIDPCFAVWKEMLTRCHDSKVQEKFPTYKGTTVCDDWLVFSNFQKWWIDNYVEGWQLDKDLLTDNKQYSPENCLYVPQWLNKFTTDRGNSRGDCLIGVCWHKSANKFQSSINDGSGKRMHLGLFNTELEAHNAWKAAKLQLTLDKKANIDAISFKLYPRIIEIINNLK